MNLILGTANFGNAYGKRIEKYECFKILDRAKELGVWAVDTAQSYGKSPDIIQEWGRGLLIFSKYKGNEEYPVYADCVLLHDEFDVFRRPELRRDGVSTYNSHLYDETGWIQAPFNPLNLTYQYLAKKPLFIARSIFLGGKFYGDADRAAIARVTFGFLRSHEVKNVVFGVESIEDLETIVEAARNNRTFDTRFE